MINLLHTFEPSPILASIGPLTLYWYGLFYAISIVLGYLIVRWSLIKRIKYQTRTLPSSSQVSNSMELDTKLLNELPDFAFWFVIVGLAGARLYHVLNEWSYYWAHPLQIFAIWNGGLAIHGALIGGLIFLWFYSRKLMASSEQRAAPLIPTTTHYPLPTTHYLFLLDLLAPAVLLGQAIGRWGNYFNQELFGYPTSLPWGIPISPANRPPEFADATYFHPTFLYESLWDLVGFIMLCALLKLFINKSLMGKGYLFGVYLIFMSTGRILIEFMRIDKVPIILALRLPMIFSVIAIIIGGGFVLLHKFRFNIYLNRL